MTQVSRNTRTPLSTISSEDKYFYLTNRDYNQYSSSIYFCLEDKGFGLNYNNIKHCYTSTNPSSNPDSAISGCSFATINYYSNKTSSGRTKYYYRFYSSNYNAYSIIYYDGNFPSGFLYVISDYNELPKSIQMTGISRNNKTSLSVSSSKDKYFYLTNSDYNSYSNYIYIYFEDNKFNLSYNYIEYCFTSTNPNSNPDTAVNDCYFTSINYYSNESSYGTYKYYYKIPINSSYTYSIVYYEGYNFFGNLDVTCGYNDLAGIMAFIPRNLKTSLSTKSSVEKYFFIRNSDYSKYSNYLNFYLEDTNFGLSYNTIKYCSTNANLYSYPHEYFKDCSFNSLSSYDSQNLSDSKRYNYKFEISSSYTYSLIYYDGSNSSGSLYVYIINENTSDEDKGLSAGAIVGIVLGLIAFVAICIIIIYYYRRCYKRNKNDFGPETQPSYLAPINSAYPLN